ncbi:hypothetical protein [Glaciecola sp. 1036]|uniref:hypothetical protein n=1 Tax=Alteromonadaceae TaxID=72275 RepID=UPI003D02873A
MSQIAADALVAGVSGQLETLDLGEVQIGDDLYATEVASESIIQFSLPALGQMYIPVNYQIIALPTKRTTPGLPITNKVFSLPPISVSERMVSGWQDDGIANVEGNQIVSIEGDSVVIQRFLDVNGKAERIIKIPAPQIINEFELVFLE